MPRENVPLGLIDDNPYNPRLHYKQNEVSELAQSMWLHGQLETPKARRKDGRVQLAFGGKRKRGFLLNRERWKKNPSREEDPDRFATQPLDIEDLTDEQMFFFAWEENCRRSDNTPLERARAIDNWLTLFPDMSEEEVGAKVGIKSQGAVSNMRRVLKLPQLFLDKIDEGQINFTIARELLVLNDLENGKELMSEALSHVNTTGTKTGYMVKAATVEGVQAAIHEVCQRHFKPLQKGSHWYGNDDPLFDTAECMKCDKLIITHPERGSTRHFCKDRLTFKGLAVCWEQKQHAAIEATAAAARAKMRDDVITKFAAVPETPAISQGIPETIEVNQEFLNETVAKSYSAHSLEGKTRKVRNPFTYNGRRWVATFLSKVGPDVNNAGCYRLVKSEEAGKEKIFRTATGEDEAGTRRQMALIEPQAFFKVAPKLADEKAAQVEKASTPASETGGLAKAVPGSVGDRYGDEWTVKEREGGAIAGVPEGVRLTIDVPDSECHACNLDAEGHSIGGKFSSGNTIFKVCIKDYRIWEKRQKPTTIVEAIPEAGVQIKVTTVPADVLALAKEKAGTRADVLDLKDVTLGLPSDYVHQFKQGYADLSGWRDKMDHPEECDTCTTGFHFAFNSQARRGTDDREPAVYNICSNPDCLAKKKGAFTRAKNAEGLARKNAERKAIKQVLEVVGKGEQGVALDKLILLAQLKGSHISSYSYHDEKPPKKWVWDRLNPGTAEEKRTDAALLKMIDKMTFHELGALLAEMSFYYLQDHNTDTGMYQVKTELPLSWFGIDIAKEAAKEAVDGSKDGRG